MKEETVLMLKAWDSLKRDRSPGLLEKLMMRLIEAQVAINQEKCLHLHQYLSYRYEVGHFCSACRKVLKRTWPESAVSMDRAS